MNKERRLFGLLLLLETAVFAWLILSRRLPRGHDTLGLYLQQYLFLAQATQAHAVALWMPNMAQGLITNWTASCQGGLLQNALLLIGGLPAGISHLPVFYAGLYLDELVLLAGIWSLGRRYYPGAPARFFVAAAAIGSTFWMDHLVCNFRSFYSLPLILSLIHDFFETGKRGKFLLASLLMALQFTGSTPYIPIFTLLVLLVYFIVHLLVFRIPLAGLLRSLRLRPTDAFLLLIPLGVLAAIYATLSHGASELRLFRPGRNPDGSVGLDDFMTFGGALNPVRYLDLVLGLSPSLDYTLYCGILTIACALIGVFHRPGKTVYHLLLCLLLVLLFSTGYLSVVSMTAYTLVPPLHFFRYVALTAPVAKLFLILLSGFGVEALLARREALRRVLKPLSGGLLAAAALLALIVGLISRNPGTLSDLNDILRTGRLGLGRRPAADDRSSAQSLLGASAIAVAAAGILLGLRARRPEAAPLLVASLLGLQVADLYRWKVQMTLQESIPLNPQQAALQKIEPVAYVARRDPKYEHSERARAWKDFPHQGAVYDFTDSFLGIDPPSSRFLMTHWLASFDALLAANERRPFDRERTEGPRLRVGNDDAYAKITGTSLDKLQVFRRAISVGSDRAVAGLLNRPDFRGDVLLLASPGPDMELGSLSGNDRISSRVTVLHFDFDSLTAKVELPPDLSEGWLMYADVWHSKWTATVNDQPVPVQRAFLAYKAVRLGPGSNVVRFHFRDPLRTACYRLVGAASLLFLAALGVLLVRLFRLHGDLDTRGPHP